MHRPSPCALALLFLPLLPGEAVPDGLRLAGGEETIRFAPEAGATLVKVFTTEGEMSVTDSEILVGDQEGAEVDLEVTWTRGLEVSDRYAAVEGGRPSKFTRTYASLDHDVEFDLEVLVEGQSEVDEAGGTRGASPLASEAVVFAWDAESGTYRKSFAEEGSDLELLDGLVEDLDLRFLLPSDAVSVGDTWEVRGDELLGLISPGGDVGLQIPSGLGAWEPVAAGIEPAFYSDLQAVLAPGGENELTATFSEVRESDGSRIAVIDLELDLAGGDDLIDLMQSRLAAIGDQLPGELDVSLAEVTFEIDGDGQLLWDLAGNHLAGLELDLDVTIEVDRAVDVDTGAEALEVTTQVTFEGELKQTVEVR